MVGLLGQRLFDPHGDTEILGWLPTAIALTAAADTDAETGLSLGRAGAIVALRAVHAETGLGEAGAAARDLTERLAALESFAGRGFANGPTGVAYALGTSPDGRHTETARRILAADQPRPDDLGWCSGRAGHLLARAALGLPGAEIATLVERNPLRDSSLCHGEFGIQDTLIELDAPDLRRAASQALGAVERYGPRCATPSGVTSPGLQTGLAGIGYGLLRLGFAERVPSVLLLAPGHRTQ